MLPPESCSPGADRLGRVAPAAVMTSLFPEFVPKSQIFRADQSEVQGVLQGIRKPQSYSQKFPRLCLFPEADSTLSVDLQGVCVPET